MTKQKVVDTKYAVARQGYRGDYEIHRKELIIGPADLALDLVRHWGRTSLMPSPGTQDPSGASTAWVLMPIEELIPRAFEAAELFYAEAEKRGMVMHLDFTGLDDED